MDSYFLSAAHDGVTDNKASDPRISANQYGLLFPFPAAFDSLIELLGLSHIVHASGFDVSLLMVVLKRT